MTIKLKGMLTQCTGTHDCYYIDTDHGVFELNFSLGEIPEINTIIEVVVGEVFPACYPVEGVITDEN